MLALLATIFLSACAVKKDAHSERKVALVIGNSSYLYTPMLANPVNDARALATALRELDFEVLEGLDLDGAAMQAALDSFNDSLKGAKAGLFYYAGHGIQVSGRNFLVPIDSNFDESLVARKGSLESRMLLLDNVLEVMDREPRVNLVFLDACRDNPLVAGLAIASNGKASRTIDQYNERGIKISAAKLQRGLAQVKARYSRNMFIAYATQPGNVALDGDGVNSPFTSALLSHIRTPDLEVRSLLTEVRKSVMAETDNRQVPWDHASLTEKFFFKPIKKTRAVAPPP